MNRREFITGIAAGGLALRAGALAAPILPNMITRIRSARSGPWSSPETWVGRRVPGRGDFVQISSGHEVTYDVNSDRSMRVVHILGTLSFARDRNTRLDAGLIKIGGDEAEDGASCAHVHSAQRPALEIGTSGRPIAPEYTALVRLTYFEGTDKDSLPAVVCCGGRMDIHGAPMNRTWVKLGAPVKKGDVHIKLAETVSGWRAGDRVILVATKRQIVSDSEDTFRETTRDNTQTEERSIVAVTDSSIALDKAAEFDHVCDGVYRGEVANLSRNVIIESADPNGVRGHTMYHWGSAGSISYAEFRRLGKRGVLGRYTLHFHQVRDSMRGSSVVGVSFWDSDNRWLTVHGTDYLVVRDCVGYNSIGHGFFLEDGTEVFNIFDRNLAVQGRNGNILPDQILPFDHNSGSGFWWANCLNTFTRNVTAECDVYGFRFDMQKTKSFDTVLSVPTADGKRETIDVRTLPFVRFEDNESHTQRNHAFNLGGLDINLSGGCGGVGPDVHHPFIVRNMRVWDSHWSFHTLAPCVMLDNYDIHNCAYGLWKPNIDRHAYRDVHMKNISNEVILPLDGEVKYAKDVERIGPATTYDLELPKQGFPQPLSPVDDLPPIVVLTDKHGGHDTQLTLRGSATDCGVIKSLRVNGHETKPLRANFAEWEITLRGNPEALKIRAEDAAGNVSNLELPERGTFSS